VYVARIRVIGAILGNVLICTRTTLYPVYRSSDAARGLNPLSDHNLAGALMMVEHIVLTILLLAWVFYRFATESEQGQRPLDLASDRGIELAPERAARAAAAGGAERLRRRLLADAGTLAERVLSPLRFTPAVAAAVADLGRANPPVEMDDLSTSWRRRGRAVTGRRGGRG
jgi:hypothetical protein